MVNHRYVLRRSAIYFSQDCDGRAFPTLYLGRSRNESYGVVHMIKMSVSEFSEILVSPDWSHIQSWLTTSQKTFTDDVDMVWDGRLDDARRSGYATHNGRAKLISMLDNLSITCAVEFE
ncbi:hypothetical protein [Aeromonas sp. JL9]|uniref:hypothetical protein n=1 Tax=Aeromonas sp. JL9 TaxID=2950549 RepID=UPI00210B9C6E|nr:hypothetical protein [Aeromonas sp. JL9]MCQ4111522.1 hypothetical protein [Aeromonas sp. JL9]